VSIGLTAFNYWDNIFPPKADTSGYVEIEAAIYRVFESGRGIRRSTILNVRYTYEGQNYTDTLRLGGYVDDRYHAGDTIKGYLDPADPKKLIAN
jgi:hypothetical protein